METKTGTIGVVDETVGENTGALSDRYDVDETVGENIGIADESASTGSPA